MVRCCAKKIIALLCLLQAFFFLYASKENNFDLPVPGGTWIMHPTAGKNAYGVFHFRKAIILIDTPQHFVLNISADPRYRFFVNGSSVAVGPSRSDVSHWRYQTIDIAPYLFAGKNILSAVVWNDGEQMAWAQLSHQTGFYINGISENESIANTDSTWKVIENFAYSPLASIAHITGAFENFFAQRYPWGWNEAGFDDKEWLTAKVFETANFSLAIPGNKRILTPSELPLPEEKMQRFASIRRFSGENGLTDNFIKGTASLHIDPWNNVTVLLDQASLITAYPRLAISGGKGAKITITYAESLYDDNGKKGNRNETDNKKIKGDYDIVWPDGGSNRKYTPLYYRTFRYVELHIENHQMPLEINDFYSLFTAYPFDQNASFVTNDTLLNKIFETGWHTARLCAFETYMDCPYYEQLQYVGDTRIQALISLYVSGDDRLMKNAIQQINYSMLPEGITQSRYPSSNQQIIPSFSLFWISMLHDYWMHKSDDAFVKQFMPSVKKILDWHQKFINENNMLGAMPYWNFVDWAKQWPWTGIENESGVPDGTTTGNSSILTLQYVMALQKASELYQYFRLKESSSFLATANKLKKGTLDNCWDNGKKLLANTNTKSTFSQHAQALAVLADVLPAKEQQQILMKTLSDSSLTQCTYYYRFYLLQALTKAGMGDEYLHQLTPWKKMIDMGLTTFAEAPEPTRSDCHAWSASPCYDLLSTVCGIKPAQSGFKSVIIHPHLGSLKNCEATMPHPQGLIKVSYHLKEDNKMQVKIILPGRLRGTFIWNKRLIKLHTGLNAFSFVNINRYEY